MQRLDDAERKAVQQRRTQLLHELSEALDSLHDAAADPRWASVDHPAITRTTAAVVRSLRRVAEHNAANPTD